MLQKRAMDQISGLPPPPVEQKTVSAPYFSRVSISLVAMVVRASSQEMRFHLPLPRSPTRCMGYLLRLGWYRA